jgi:biotin carboxyl carrier protein
VVVLVVAATSGSKPGTAARGLAAAPATGPDAPLKPHPRVVIAVDPGAATPVDQSTYASASAEQSFQPPSDAEVKRELGQLHVAEHASAKGYADPFSQIRGLTPERIDMGVDYSGTGPVLALGSGTVFNTNGGGWPGGVFVGIKLDSGPYAGRAYFVAEDVKPTVRVGDHVRAGQQIASMYHGSAGIETGWAAGSGDQPLAEALGQQNKSGDPGGWSSAAGISFDRVLVAVGTPSGVPQGTQVHGKMPAGYP